MLKDKNSSPAILALLSALVLAVLFILPLLLFPLLLWQLLLLFIFSLIIAYLIIYYVIAKFIYRKIKVIYKLIGDTKTNKGSDIADNRKGLDSVEKDVRQWAVEKRDELEGMKKNEQFRKEFLLNLSHELKTPVFAIQGYIHTLLDGAIDDQEVNKKFLRNATKNTDRLAQLIEDLGIISKLESGELPLNKEAFVIQELVTDAFDALSIKAKEKGINLSIKKGCETPIKVYADKEKIRQVLLNLLDNSIKYGKPEGHTVASVYKVDEESVLVEISDNGLGIDKAQLQRVFERFFRADKNRSRAEGGTGLGLAIVKHIIEAHGQNINVRSKPTVGTTFGFTLKMS